MRISVRLVSLLVAAACAAPVPLLMAQTGGPVEGKAATHLVEAEKYRAAGDYRAAIIELKNAVLEAPWSPRLHKELGETYLAIGDNASAEKELRRAIDRDPEWLDPRLLLAEAWLAQGQADKVLNELWAADAPHGEDRALVHVLHGRAHLQKDDIQGAREAFKLALEEQADYALAYLGMARAALQEGEPSMAQLHLENAEQASGEDPAAVLDLKGDLAVERGDYATAEQAYKDAAKLEPQQIEYLTQLARVQIEQGKFDEAEATLEKVLANRPDDPTAIYYRAYGAYRRGEPQTAFALTGDLLSRGAVNPAVFFIRGGSAYYLGHYELARDSLERYLEQHPDDVAAHHLLAGTYLQLEDPARALELLRPIVEQPDAAPELVAVAGIAALRARKFTTGSGYLERAADQMSGAKRLRLLAGAAKVSSGDAEEGLAELEELVDSSEGGRQLELSLLEERVRRGEFEEAIRLAERYQKRYPTRAEGWALGGIALVRTGELEGARRAFEEALKLSPGHPDAGIGLAEIALKKGDTEAARKALEAVLRHHPDNEAVIINLASIEFRDGAADAAVRRLEQALEASPESSKLRLTLARAYLQEARPIKVLEVLQPVSAEQEPEALAIRGEAQLRAGRDAEAVESFRDLVEAWPDAAAPHAGLAAAYEATGGMDAALHEYEQALAVNPDLSKARIGLARVRLLSLQFPPPQEQLVAEVKRIRELAEAYPGSVDMARLVAFIDSFTGRHDKAIATLASAYDATDDGRIAIELAKTQQRAGRSGDAVATLRTHVTSYPEDIAVRLALSDQLMAERSFAAASLQLSEALALDDQRRDLQGKLAYALVRAGRVQEAGPHARAAYAVFPDDPRVVHARGVVQLEEGRAADAADLLARAVRMEGASASPALRLDYARALAQSGQQARARSELEALLDDEPPLPERAEASTLLHSLTE